MSRFALLALLLAGCGSDTTPAEAPATSSPAVPADGRRFDPPVEPSEIPDDAWMCDMGTVHYAAGEKHDGKCPVCGMKLTQKGK